MSIHPVMPLSRTLSQQPRTKVRTSWSINEPSPQDTHTALARFDLLGSGRPSAPEPVLTPGHIVALQDSIDQLARELRLHRTERATSPHPRPAGTTTTTKTDLSRTTSTAVTNVTQIRTTTSVDCRCGNRDTVGEHDSALDTTIESVERLDEGLNVSDPDTADIRDFSTYPYQHIW